MKKLIIYFIFILYVNTEANVTRPLQGPSSSSSNSLHPVVESIEDVCVLFDIPLVNCSCEMFIVNGSDSMFPDLCAIVKHINKTHTILVYSAALSRSYASVTVIASIVGFIGNIAVILVAYRKRKTLPRCKFLIAQLAASDLIFAIIQFILAIPSFWTNKWLYGGFMCKILRSGITLDGLVSISFILMIGLERYLGILYPLQKKLSASLIKFISASFALVAIFSVIPLIVVLGVDTEMGRCSEHWSNDDSAKYNWFLLICYFIIPVSIISYFYIKIIQYLRAQVDSNLIKDENGKRKRIKDNRRIMVILLSILFAFVICILPNRIVWIYFDAVNYKMGRKAYMILSFFALIPYPIHVAVNPIIYSIVDKTWRTDIIEVLTVIPRPKSRSSTTSTSTILSNDVKNKKDENKYGSILDQAKGRRSNSLNVDHNTQLITYNPMSKTDITAEVVNDDDVFDKI